MTAIPVIIVSIANTVVTDITIIVIMSVGAANVSTASILVRTHSVGVLQCKYLS